jgi:hypothetical protein
VTSPREPQPGAGAATGAALARAAAAFHAEANLPSAELLLRRAAAERRRAVTERALRPLRAARLAAGAAAAGVAVALGPQLLRLVKAPALPSVRRLLPTSGQAAAVVLATLLLTALVTALWLDREEA